MSDKKFYTNEDVQRRVFEETGIRMIDLGELDDKKMTAEEFEQRSAKLKRMVTLAFEDVDRQNRGVMDARNQSRQKDHE